MSGYSGKKVLSSSMVSGHCTGDGRERWKADAGLKEHILWDSCCLIQSQPVFRMMTEPLQMAEGSQLANHIVVRY